MTITGPDLRARREALGLSRLQLAVSADVSPDSIYRWEQGRASPRPAIARAIVAALERAEASAAPNEAPA